MPARSKPRKRRPARGLRTPSRLSIEEVRVLKLRIEFTVSNLEGVEYSGIIRLVDAVEIERHFGVSLTEEDPKNWSFDHLMFGAYNALRRAGADVGEYDAFLAQVDGFDMPDEEEGAVPKDSEESPPASSALPASSDPAPADSSTSANGVLTNSMS